MFNDDNIKKAVVQYDKSLLFPKQPTLIIDNYKWESNGYEPCVEVFLSHNAKKIAVKFVTYEKNPRRLVQNDGGEVWTDSCVEFFFIPAMDEKRYINLEINANGKAVMAIGRGRDERRSLVSEYKNALSVFANTEADRWTVCYEIPFDILKKIYGVDNLSNKFYANFYKCGDCTEQPHFGMWNDIKLDRPDFHVPQFFGCLVLQDQ